MTVGGTPPGVRVVGRYALYGVIASGGMATVHLGRLLGPVGFSRTVAIKRLHPQFAADPDFVSMFLDEARLVARIRHPHVVPTLDVVSTEGELFLVMEYVPGESLARLVHALRARGERIPVSIVVSIMSGVLQGLHAAHEAQNERGEPLGIVHRDVSPQNVLVGSDGQARVLDFGVAKAAGRVQTTREGQLKGKLSYMAPEQLRGQTLTRKTDIYAAAVVLWEALLSERLFRADNEGAVVTRILEAPVPPPSRRLIEVTTALGNEVRENEVREIERLDAVVLRGLARDPAKRFDTARDMAIALEKCCTPATGAEISGWIATVANSVLLRRAEQVAEMESSGSSIARPPTIPDLSGEALAAGGPVPVDDAGSQSGVRPGVGLSDPLAQASSQPSSMSVEANLPPTSNRRRWVVALALAAALAIALPVGLALSGLHPLPDSGHEKAAASIVASASPDPSGTTSPGGALTPPPPVEAPPALTDPGVSASARLAPSAVPPPAKRPVNPSPRPKRGDCNPPFTWDAEGMKHYKPECL